MRVKRFIYLQVKGKALRMELRIGVVQQNICIFLSNHKAMFHCILFKHSQVLGVLPLSQSLCSILPPTFQLNPPSFPTPTFILCPITLFFYPQPVMLDKARLFPNEKQRDRLAFRLTFCSCWFVGDRVSIFNPGNPPVPTPCAYPSFCLSLEFEQLELWTQATKLFLVATFLKLSFIPTVLPFGNARSIES